MDSKQKDNNSTAEFSSRLKELINEKGLSLRDLAADMGVTFTALSDWQRGNKTPRADSIVILARYFGVSSDYLLGLTSIRTIETNVRAISEYTGLSEDAVKVLSDPNNPHLLSEINDIGKMFPKNPSIKDIFSDFVRSAEFSTFCFELGRFFSQYLRFAEAYKEKRHWVRNAPRTDEFYTDFLKMFDTGFSDFGLSGFFSEHFVDMSDSHSKQDIIKTVEKMCSDEKDYNGDVLWDKWAFFSARSEAKEELDGADLCRFRMQQALQKYLDNMEANLIDFVLESEQDASNHKTD